MYAIIQTGGKQYRVGEGDLLRVERLAGEPGQQVAFDEVLFVGDPEAPAVGSPTVDGARVLATVVRHGRGDKVLVFKFKRRKMYRRKKGHRQEFTEVRVDRLETAGGGKAAASGKAEKAPRKTAPAKAKAKADPAETKAKKKAVEGQEPPAADEG